jgi:hypothetical protein
MKKPVSIILFIGLSLASYMPIAEIDGSYEFDVVYNVYRDGFKVAKMQRTLTKVADGNMLYSVTKTTGIVSLFRKDKIVEKSIWKNIDGKLMPEFYEYLRTGSKRDRNVTVQFDWDKNQIINSVDGSSWKMPTVDGVLDKLLYQYSIMLDLQQGKSSLRYIIADGGKEKIYLFETVGEETIETPLGKLDTVKLKRKRQDSDRQSIFWSAPEMNYLPVKLEITDEGDSTVVVIESLTVKSGLAPELVLR